jgi:hypothetical protein
VLASSDQLLAPSKINIAPHTLLRHKGKSMQAGLSWRQRRRVTAAQLGSLKLTALGPPAYALQYYNALLTSPKAARLTLHAAKGGKS